jgi:hypothetical protein
MSKNNKLMKNNKNSNKQRAVVPPRVKHSSVAHPTTITADETDVTLRYRSVGVRNASTPQFAKSWTPNAAYDVDPLLGSTETYGFDEYAAFYSYYRVVEYSYKIQVSAISATTDPVTIYILNTNTQPTGTAYDLFSTNPYCQTKPLTAYGINNTLVFQGNHRVSQIVGSMTVETEDNYRALTTGVPSDLVWLTMAGECRTNQNPAWEWVADIWMTVRFYGREIDLTLAALVSRLQQKLNKKAEYELLRQLKNGVTVQMNKTIDTKKN